MSVIFDMDGEELYKQCQFKQGTRHTTAWIPAHAAKVGNLVELIGEGPEPDEFWEVTMVGSQTMKKSQVNKQSRVYKEFQGSTRGGGID